MARRVAEATSDSEAPHEARHQSFGSGPNNHINIRFPLQGFKDIPLYLVSAARPSRSMLSLILWDLIVLVLGDASLVEVFSGDIACGRSWGLQCAVPVDRKGVFQLPEPHNIEFSTQWVPRRETHRAGRSNGKKHRQPHTVNQPKIM